MGYAKLHSSLINSSLWTEPSSVRVLFITLLALADREGTVYGSRCGISRLANIDPETHEEAWATLLAPDPDSSDLKRVPENEGRRIEEVEGGFRIINYAYYRSLRNDDDRREQNRKAQARFKAKAISHGKPKSSTISPVQPHSAYAEAEAEAGTGKGTAPTGFQVPTIDEVKLLMAKIALPESEAEKFWNFYESKGWMIGKNKMKRLSSAVANWAAHYRQWNAYPKAADPLKPTGPELIVLHEEFKRVEAKMKSIKDSYAEHQSWSEQDYQIYNKLRARKAQLKKLLGMQV